MSKGIAQMFSAVCRVMRTQADMKLKTASTAVLIMDVGSVPANCFFSGLLMSLVYFCSHSFLSISASSHSSDISSSLSELLDPLLVSSGRFKLSPVFKQCSNTHVLVVHTNRTKNINPKTTADFDSIGRSTHSNLNGLFN